ncbi:C-type lectin, partial [Elysia marginata]
ELRRRLWTCLARSDLERIANQSLWKSPHSSHIGQYKCVANGLGGDGRVVTISLTSDASTPGTPASDIDKWGKLSQITKTFVATVANSTREIEDGVETVGTNVGVVLRKFNQLETALEVQNSTIQRLEDHISSLTELYKSTYLASNFDVSERFRENLYFVSKVVARFNIQAADALCGLLGGYLVEIDDQEEYNFVLKFLQTVGGTESFFTGGNDLEKEGVFRFWRSNRLVTFLNWGGDNPSNSHDGEHCIEIRFGHNRYNDLDCNAQAKYVCEASAQ